MYTTPTTPARADKHLAKYIDIASLYKRLPEIRKNFFSAKPFHYVMFDNFFSEEVVDLVYENYPKIENGVWDGTTYLDQRNKFQKTKFPANSVMDEIFKELNSQWMLGWLDDLAGFDDKLVADYELFGGGLHQSTTGAYLNVHVDFNIHPKTKYHRRLNLLIYMNKDWKDEYQGHIELWDLTNNRRNMLGKYAPLFNRCVIFETNEISFHGHPKPLECPEGMSRKSIALYYYTKNRPKSEIVNEHNTIYVNTEGLSGHVRRFTSGVRAALERINSK